MWQKIKNYYHLAQAFLWASYFGFPSKKLIVIGVTGTDGKTTTVNMIYHILKASGQRVSMVSSVNSKIGEKDYDTGFHVSTPNPHNIQKFLKQAQNAKSKYFVLEATSHGLDQNRLAFIDFEIGVLTNITHEHLDYHKTRKNYIQSKLKLFKNAKKSVLNLDDSSYSEIKSQIKGQKISYSLKNPADFNLKNTAISLNIPGDYNLQNALAAIAAATSLGIPKKKAINALKSFTGVKGRMEAIDEGQDFDVFVDFAHTPNGLENALKTLKAKNGSGRIIAVFGAASQRDESKRPRMGKVADKFADVIVLTAEDPRREDPNDICMQISKGIKNKKLEKNLFVISDRQQAINFAIRMASSNDTVAIFGKGHETSMNIGGKELPWSDFEAVENALKKTNEK